MPYADEAGKRLLLHALYLGAASGYQPTGGQLRINTTLELMVPGVAAGSMHVHSPVAKGELHANLANRRVRPGEGQEVYANEPTGTRLTLPNPAVYFVVELALL
jgi:hypothetical protein